MFVQSSIDDMMIWRWLLVLYCWMPLHLKCRFVPFFSNLSSILWSWCWGGEDQAGQEEAGEEFLNITVQKSNLIVIINLA